MCATTILSRHVKLKRDRFSPFQWTSFSTEKLCLNDGFHTSASFLFTHAHYQKLPLTERFLVLKLLLSSAKILLLSALFFTRVANNFSAFDKIT